MKSSLKSLVSVLVGFVGVILAGFASSASFEQYIPSSGVIQGKLMRLHAPKAYTAIAEKMKMAIQKDSEWFLQYMKENENRRPLPYHRRLGVTESEYKVILRGAEMMELREAGALTIRIRPLQDGAVELNTDDFGSPLNGIRVFPKQNFVETRYGKLANFSEINQRERTSPTGRWQGIQWKREEQIGSGGVVITFAIGKRLDAGDGIIYYDVKNFVPGSQERHDTIVVYSMK